MTNIEKLALEICRMQNPDRVVAMLDAALSCMKPKDKNELSEDAAREAVKATMGREARKHG